jgi:hypothetical protein
VSAGSQQSKLSVIAGTPSPECQPSQLSVITEKAKEQGVSLRTARRMLKPDYVPSEEHRGFYGQVIPGRTIGKDGKSYPHNRNRYSRKVVSNWDSRLIRQGLNFARHGLKKADTVACESGFQPKDIASLKSVARIANEMLSRWMEVSQ